MVIGYLLVVNHLRSLNRKRHACRKRHGLCNTPYQSRQLFLHVMGQKTAVCSRVGHQTLFIQGLRVSQRLLGCVAKDVISIPLQRGQVIKLGRFLGLLLSDSACDCYCLTGALGTERVRFRLIREAFGLQRQIPIQLHGVKLLGLEVTNAVLTTHDHRERGTHDAPNLERSSIQERIQSRCIHPHQPIRMFTAQGSLIQQVIVLTASQLCKALPDCILLQRRNPKPFYRKLAACLRVNQSENQLAFPSGIRCADNAGNLLAVHELFQHLILFTGL